MNPENDLISRLGPSVAFDLSHPAEEVKAEPTIMSKLIQWDQPDDIPSIDDVEVESSAQLPAFEQPFSVSIAERGSAPVTESRHLINWEQPEDDIPSIEDVIDARSQEAVPAVHAIHFEPEDSAVVAVIKRPRSAESDEPSTAQVSEAAIGSVPHKAIDIDFFPTILGEKSRHEDARPRPQYTSILNAYDTPQAARSVPYRSISIGVVLMAVAAVIGLGGDPLWRYFTAPEPDRSIAEVPNKQERMPTQSMRSAMVEPAASDSEQAAASFNEIPSYDGPASASTAERPRPDSPKARSRRQARSGTVTNEAVRGKNTPIEPSTLVITYGNGGVKSANSAQKVSREKESRPTGDRPAGATRPRIVANPQ